MTVKHFRFYGTKEEIELALKVLPQHASDRTIEKPNKFYDHMNKNLGVEIWTVCISKQAFNDSTVGPIQRLAERHPLFMYEITNKLGKVINNGLETFTNFEQEDPSFPGPYGALCKRYGKNYFPTEEARLANVARYNQLMDARKCNDLVAH